MASNVITSEDLKNRFHLTSEDLDKEVSEEHLREASRIIEKHKLVGFELGLTSQEMADIDKDGQSQELRRMMTLKTWKQKNPYKATYKDLIDALLKCKRGDNARDVCELLSQSKSSQATASVGDSAISSQSFHDSPCTNGTEQSITSPKQLPSAFLSEDEVKRKVENFSEWFNKMTFDTRVALQEGNIPPKEVICFLTMPGPNLDIRNEHKEFVDTLNTAADILDLFIALNKYWDHFNYHLLKQIITPHIVNWIAEDKYLKLKGAMEEYIQEMDRFKQQATIGVYCKVFVTQKKEVPEGFKELVTEYQLSKTSTLYDVEKFRQSVAQQYQLHTCLVLLKNISFGSVKITWWIPIEATNSPTSLQLESSYKTRDTVPVRKMTEGRDRRAKKSHNSPPVCQVYIVLCVDVSPSMNTAPPDEHESETPLQISIKVATRIVRQKMFEVTNISVGLVLFGTSDAGNELAHTKGGYPNIIIAWKPSQASTEFLQYLTTQVQPGGASGDLLNAVEVAVDVLMKATATVNKVAGKTIYLFTNARSEYSDSGLHQICAALKKNEAKLEVISPDSGGSHERKAGDRGGGGRRSKGDGNEGQDGDRCRGNEDTYIKKTPQQVTEESVPSTAEVHRTFRKALQSTTFIHTKAKKQIPQFAGYIEIGQQLKIRCKIFTQVMKKEPSKWKLSAVDTSIVKKKKRKMDKTKKKLSSVHKGYHFEKAMKTSHEHGLSVLGFTPKECVHQHQTVGSSVRVVVPYPGDQYASKAFSALIHAMDETGSVGVARYVLRKKTGPKLVALHPQITTSHESLLMLQLPYKEDVTLYRFGSLPGPGKSVAPTEEQLSAVDDLITGMDLMTADINDDGEECEALRPSVTHNPVIQRTSQCIFHRFHHPDDPLPDMDPNLSQFLQPNASVSYRSMRPLAKIQKLFLLEKENNKGLVAASATQRKISELDPESEEVPTAKESHVDEEEVDTPLGRREVTELRRKEQRVAML